MASTPTGVMESNQQLPAANEHAIHLNPSHNIIPLDVLRGIAVLGAMFISIWLFGGFSENQQTGLLTQSKGLNYRAFSTVSILLEGKMRALIAIVFGASMLLYLFKDKQRKQLHNAEFFIRRQLWLIAFGLINAFVFLWTGDLLFHLGMMGVLLFPFVRLSSRGLLIAAIITSFIYCGKIYWRYSDHNKTYGKYLAVLEAEKKIKKDSIAKAKSAPVIKNTGKDSALKKQNKDTLTKKQTQEKQAWEGLVKGMKYDPIKDEEKNKAMQTVSYAKIWDHQLRDTQGREAQWTYTEGIWDLSSMMFLGMALLSFGFFDPGLSTKKYLLIALVSLGIGVLLGWLRLHYNALAVVDYEKYIKRYLIPNNFFFPFEIGFMATGYASLILVLIRLSFMKGLWKVIAVTGQMALTNYLLQSIVCVIFFDGFSMGYFGKLQQWQLYIFAAEVILVNIAFSVLWLKHFNYGPAEWLWRSLIYKKWIANRKNSYDVERVNAVS